MDPFGMTGWLFGLIQTIVSLYSLGRARRERREVYRLREELEKLTLVSKEIEDAEERVIVIRPSGAREKFSFDKLVGSLMGAGIPASTSLEVAKRVAKRMPKEPERMEMESREIEEIVKEELIAEDPSGIYAKWFLEYQRSEILMRREDGGEEPITFKMLKEKAEGLLSGLGISRSEVSEIVREVMGFIRALRSPRVSESFVNELILAITLGRRGLSTEILSEIEEAEDLINAAKSVVRSDLEKAISTLIWAADKMCKIILRKLSLFPGGNPRENFTRIMRQYNRLNEMCDLMGISRESLSNFISTISWLDDLYARLRGLSLIHI